MNRHAAALFVSLLNARDQSLVRDQVNAYNSAEATGGVASTE